MSYSQIPNEILDCILVLAVRVRGAKRATRLRLVSRRWNAATERALFYSGILDDPYCLSISGRFSTSGAILSFWQRYLTFKALHRDRLQASCMGIIIRAAKFVVEARKTSGDTDQSVKDLVSKMSQAVVKFSNPYVFTRAYLSPEPDPARRLCAHPKVEGVCQPTVIALAALIEDVALLGRLRRRGPDKKMVEGTAVGFSSRCGVLPDLYEIAANFGSTKILSWLLQHDPDSQSLGRDRSLITWAMRGNQKEVLELALGPTFSAESPDFVKLRSTLVSGLQFTTSLDIFRSCIKLLGVTHFRLIWAQADPMDHLETVFLKRFLDAAGRGSVPMMEYLYQLGTPIDQALDSDADDTHPIRQAAIHGHADAVKWLLKNGADVTCSLPAAVLSGSERIVQLLIEHDALDDTTMVQRAFLMAIDQENESIFRLLVAHGAWPNEATISRALALTKAKRLESMYSFLQDYLVKSDE
ncbi:ankyrin [Xylariaceae sp. FL1272]|nr:ankyrin [Xylariaceae sp. FL1272]